MTSVASASDATRPSTAEDLQDMPDDGMRYELVEGEMRVVAPAGYEHGRISGEIYFAIKGFVRAKGLGDVLAAETGFLLRRAPDTVRAPDVAFVRAERTPEPEQRSGFVHVVPDLVVEVVSPSDRAADVNAKALMWLDAGVRLVWVIYPETQVVAAHTPDGVVHIVREDAVLDGGDVLPGFILPLRELFTG